MDFTAGITFTTGEILTVDVEDIDDQGIRYRAGDDTGFAPWREIKAVMLATTDHMLESAGYMMEVSEVLREQQQRQPYDADAMRARGLGLLRQAAPRLCPNGDRCPLAGPPKAPPPGEAS